MKSLIRTTGLLFVFLGLALAGGFGQSYSRIRADFSIKSKAASGTQSLTVGQVYYDKNLRQLIFYVTFPEKQIWITADTVIYQIRDGKLVSRTPTFALTDFTIFHLALNSRMQDFGLGGTTYTVTNISREKDLVITTWTPPVKARSELGNILVSVRNKQLFGVIFQDPAGTALRKQFFEDYQLVSGLAFPARIVEIDTKNGIDNYQVTTYRNITVDELENDDKYYYNLGSLHQ